MSISSVISGLGAAIKEKVHKHNLAAFLDDHSAGERPNMAAPSQAAEAELESATSPPRTISEREFNEAMALLSGGEDSQYLLYSFQDYWKSGKVPKELVDPGSIIWEHWEQVTGAQAAILRAAVFCCRKMFDDNSNRRFAEKLSGFQVNLLPSRDAWTPQQRPPRMASFRTRFHRWRR